MCMSVKCVVIDEFRKTNCDRAMKHAYKCLHKSVVSANINK